MTHYLYVWKILWINHIFIILSSSMCGVYYMQTITNLTKKQKLFLIACVVHLLPGPQWLMPLVTGVLQCALRVSSTSLFWNHSETVNEVKKSVQNPKSVILFSFDWQLSSCIITHCCPSWVLISLICTFLKNYFPASVPMFVILCYWNTFCKNILQFNS